MLWPLASDILSIAIIALAVVIGFGAFMGMIFTEGGRAFAGFILVVAGASFLVWRLLFY